jgi:outer membrane receptor protein involved in Fe transport
MKYELRIFIWLLLTQIIFTDVKAQTVVIKVVDALNNGPVSNATVAVNGNSRVSSEEGLVYFNIKSDSLLISIKHVSYKTINVYNKLNFKDTTIIDVPLIKPKLELNTITVSGSRFHKRAAEEIVSIEVLKPSFIKNAAINRVDEALNKLPGVDVLENQINIRGGAGWSYGAGSRVMVMVDDMPMLSADAADAKWDFLPLENVEQIEVLKGAASALYGSGALNGVVNFKTAFAKNKPVTKIQIFGGQFDHPTRKEMIWWQGANPGFGGAYLTHARKIKNLDIVFGGAYYRENSYLQGDQTNRGRANFNLRYHPKQVEGLTIGLNGNLQISKSQTFFFHVADTNMVDLLRPYGGLDSNTTLNKNDGSRFNIDPYLTFIGKNGWTHHLRTRLFSAQNKIPLKKQSSLANSYYAEYQAIKKWKTEHYLTKNLVTILGVVGAKNIVSGELYGNHTTSNMAPYIQVEKKISKVWLAAGARKEFNNTDRARYESRAVYRIGANYQPLIGTNVRASYGEGYRYPTIAERFVNTSFGAAKIFPNTNLQSEFGNSREIGIKQVFAHKKWVGFFDAAWFDMRYKNMMEFNFLYVKPTDPLADSSILANLGFQSLNIGDTRINGTDISLNATHKGKFTHNLLLGYTFIKPRYINFDSATNSNISTNENFLKYRYQHSLKGTYELNVAKWGFASINTLVSPMKNIDAAFDINGTTKNLFASFFQTGTGLPAAVSKHRNLYNKWNWVGDIRCSYQFSTKYRAAIVAKNVGNTEYYHRPAIIGALRSFTIQFFADL